MVYLKVESTGRGVIADLPNSLAFLYIQYVFESLLSFATKKTNEVVTFCLSN